MLFGVSAAIPAQASTATVSTTTVKLMLDWVPNPDHIGLYYAYEHGMFTKEGIKLDIQVPSGNEVASVFVATNKADIGISSPSTEFAAGLEGLPITGVSTFIPNTLNAVIISGKSGIKTLKGLVGKSVGYYSGQGQIDLNYMLMQAGVNPSSVKEVSVGTALVPSIVSGKVTAILGGLTNVEAIQIGQEMGVKPAVLTWSSLGYPPQPEFTVIANSNRLTSSASYRSIVKKFITALVDGEKGAEANPASATAIMEKVTQYTKPFLVASDPVTLQALEPTGGAWGCFNFTQLQTAAKFDTTHKLITGPVVTTKLFSNSYIPWSCPSS
jgi:putative hydroxymethylpyrimidine transport system substrate-binding protein